MARRPYLGVQMEGPIAAWYDRSTRGRIPEFVRTADAIASWLPGGARILEVAPGPGFLAIELAKRGYSVSGLDISRSFVRIAADHAATEAVRVDLRQGDVARMPFADDSFDFIVCVAAFKNFPEPVRALDEMHRVLRPGGTASIRDLRKDATREDIAAEVSSMGLGRVSAAFTRWTFRHALLRAAYNIASMEELVARSRFTRAEIRTDGIGFDVRARKASGAAGT